MKTNDRVITPINEAYTETKRIVLLRELFELGMSTEVDIKKEAKRIFKINPKVVDDPTELLMTIAFLSGVNATAQLIDELGKSTSSEGLRGFARNLMS